MSAQELITRITTLAGPYALPALAVVGALSVLSCTFKWLGAFSSLFLLSGVNLRKYGPRGSWALVTGASDGVGKEFALQLASKGFNVILVSRTASKLDALATEITTKYPVIKTKTLAMDFEKDENSDYDRLKQLISGLDVSILINNVGRSHAYPVSFLETKDEEMENIITINVKGTLKVTKAVAPGMVERKRGLILTMGSFGGFVPTPFLATYSGSKAFLQHWSTALHSELKPHGVEVNLVIAYLIVSAMSKVRKPSLMIPTPKAWVKSCLGKIGVTGTAGGRAGTITPFWSHGLMHCGIEYLAGVYNGFVLNFNRKMHLDIRRRALRKMEREAKKQ